MNGSPTGSGKRILYIEDDPAVATMVRVTLSLAGYEVVEASKGTQGLDLLYTSFPHAVLLDLRMPVLGGLGILDIIRGKSGLREVPVICLTALAEPEDIYAALYRGADAYLVKPIDFDLLKLVLAYLLEDRDRLARARELAGYDRAGDILDLLGKELDLLPKLEAMLLLAKRGVLGTSELYRFMVYRGEDLGRVLDEMVSAGMLEREGDSLRVAAPWRDRAAALARETSRSRGLELAANLVHMGVNLLDLQELGEGPLQGRN